MTKVRMTTPCPKCGDNTWDGPRFKSTFYPKYIGECLTFECNTCRYVTVVPCLDAEKE
jgi:hypothetical protein